MPLPLILGVGAAITGVVGVGTGVHGAVKMKDANDTMNQAKTRHEKNVKRFESNNKKTTKSMDKLGTLELEILHSFSDFSDLFEQIKNRPNFEEHTKEGIKLPKYDGEKLKEVSVGAGVLLGGLGGAGVGAAGGFAAAGATTAAVMAFGTASTGTAIATLSGAALTNATLAALGGGAVAAGGGGIALGTTLLGAATLGVGLLVGGAIFSFTGSKLSDKADEAYDQMIKAENKINSMCSYLSELKGLSDKYSNALYQVNNIYTLHLEKMSDIIVKQKKTDWNFMTVEEKNIIDNSILLVGLLYNMCKVELVLKTNSKNGLNKVNKIKVNESIDEANKAVNLLK